MRHLSLLLYCVASVGCADSLESSEPVPASSAVPERVMGALAGLVSPELGTDQAVNSPAPDRQTDVAIAFGGGVYLAVWTDPRATVGYDIHGARISPQGQLVDPTGFRISQASGFEGPAALAYAGGKFLVVWQDNGNSYPNSASSDIHGAFVTPAAAVGTSFVISAASNNQGNPTVASNGSEFLVAWDDTRNGASNADIYAARVRTNGSVRDPSGIAVSRAAKDQRQPALSWDGSRYLAVWEDARNATGTVATAIYGARISANGSVQDSNGIAIRTGTTYARKPAVAANAGVALVAWEDSRNHVAPSYSGSDIYAARVRSNGTIADAAGLRLSSATASEAVPSIAWNGQEFAVAWQVPLAGTLLKMLAGARVSATASTTSAVLATDRALSDDTEVREYAALASDGTSTLLAWQAQHRAITSTESIYGARLGNDLSRLDAHDLLISAAANAQSAPAVASGADGESLLVWVDTRSGSGSAHCARVLADGTVLDPFGVALGPDLVGTAAKPRALFDATRGHYLVVWSVAGFDAGVWARRVRAFDGALVDPAPVSLTNMTAYSPALAFDGDDFLVAWTSTINGRYQVHSRKVGSADGTPTDDAQVPLPNSDYQYNPDLAFDGTHYLLVHSEQTAGAIYATYFDRAGNIVGTPRAVLATGIGSYARPRVAYDGVRHFVAWHAFAPDPQVRGTRVAADPFAADPALDGVNGFRISDAGRWSYNPGVVFDGVGFVVAWDQYDATSIYDVFAAYVHGTGGADAAFPIVGDLVDTRNGAIGALGNGQSAIAYTLYDASPAIQSTRARWRTLSRP